MSKESDCVIDVQKISKSFDGRKVVDELSLQIKRGEVFGFLGPNGSGKTTSIRMICGLLTPDSGRGTCLGLDIIKQSALIKRKVGYMTQHFSLYEDLSLAENLHFTARMYGLPHRKKRVAVALEELRLTERQDHLAGELSGGWKQRLALAVALLHEPEVLLLDEPTAGVDPSARREFWDHIHLLATRGITTLVSTHYMDEAERCNRIAYLSQGHLLTQGTISEVVKQVGLTTWSVRGKKLAALAEQLKVMPDIEQVIAFGETLHVSAKDGAQLEAAIRPLQTGGYAWQKIESNLENAFVYLVDQAEDEPLYD